MLTGGYDKLGPTKQLTGFWGSKCTKAAIGESCLESCLQHAITNLHLYMYCIDVLYVCPTTTTTTKKKQRINHNHNQQTITTNNNKQQQQQTVTTRTTTSNNKHNNEDNNNHNLSNYSLYRNMGAGPALARKKMQHPQACIGLYRVCVYINIVWVIKHKQEVNDSMKMENMR